MMPIQVVFFGSPLFAVPILKALNSKYKVVGVVSQPDRPSGRGRKITSPPIKILTQEFNLPVIQPESLRNKEVLAQLKEWEPDLIVVAAYGQILKPEILNLPEYGCINVHASLLPRWRGAAPIQAAILHGDQTTGITIMLMDPGMDTGPILSQEVIPVKSTDTADTLSNRLSNLGANLLLETIPKYLSASIKPIPQDEKLVTYARLIKKEEGNLDFNKSAIFLERQIRAYNPWPGTFTRWRGKILKIHTATVYHSPGNSSDTLLPGTRMIHSNFPAIITSNGILVLKEVQPEGKKPMAGDIFLRGAHEWIDT